jgi:hypothetical protein
MKYLIAAIALTLGLIAGQASAAPPHSYYQPRPYYVQPRPVYPVYPYSVYPYGYPYQPYVYPYSVYPYGYPYPPRSGLQIYIR